MKLRDFSIELQPIVILYILSQLFTEHKKLTRRKNSPPSFPALILKVLCVLA